MKQILLVVLSSVALAITGILLNWSAQIWRFVQRHAKPDHTSILRDWNLQGSRPSGLVSQIQMQVTCAPARSLKLLTINPDACMNLVKEHFNGVFELIPAQSIYSSGIRFETSKGGLENGYFYIWKSGRIDLVIPIPTKIEPDFQVNISILDLIKPIEKIRDISISSEYLKIFPRRKFQISRRFDWFIAVSPTLTMQDGITKSWDSISFPSHTPPRAGFRQPAYCPEYGYARDQLRNWDPKKRVKALLRIFFMDFLLQNGFYDCESNISTLLKEFNK